MAASNKAIQEQVGAAYNRDQMQLVRAKTREAVHAIAREIRVGMAETEGEEIARRVLKAGGLLRGWHGIKVRFGVNTTKGFSAPSEPNTILQKDDIFFIDIGPVWQKWEGDAGETFTVGTDSEMQRCARDVRTVFDRVQSRWLTERLTGKALYDYAVQVSDSLGWQLNLDMNGHRLSEFPHAAHFDGSLAGTEFTPAADLWVLEIQIRHPTREIGAFYEDLLLQSA